MRNQVLAAAITATLTLCLVAPAPAAPPQTTAAASIAAIPLAFEENRGQTDASVRFLSRGPGYSLFLTSGEAVLALPGGALRIEPVGADRAAPVAGLEPLPGKASYFRGSDPAAWRTGVRTYGRVAYRDVYPGIDLVYYGVQRKLEYDFVVRPGADPGRIALRFDGAERLEVDARGDLVVRVGGGEVVNHAPKVYQERDGRRSPIAGRYVIAGPDLVRFEVGAYDEALALVIDPVLSFATYFGGTLDDFVEDVALDAAGNVYVTGFTRSVDFPIVSAIQDTIHASPFNFDSFVVKLNPTGGMIVYSTYLGGTENENANGLAVDAAGNAFVTGRTNSDDFPTTPGVAQPTTPDPFSDFDAAFVAKLDPDGSTLVYSTYLGGFGHDRGQDVALDAAGNAYVIGDTTSSNFPVTAGAYRTTPPGGEDAFVVKLNPAGASLYATYLGSPQTDNGRGIAVDGAGKVHVTGQTFSKSLFPTTGNAFRTQSTDSGTTTTVGDAFVTKLDLAGAGTADLVYSTYLGGVGADRGFEIAVDANGHAYVAGDTFAATFPTTAGVVKATKSSSAGRDGFVTKLDMATAGPPLYSTFIGVDGSLNNDSLGGIALDGAGNAWIAGLFGDVIKGFAAKLNATATAFLHTELFATSDRWRIAADACGNAAFACNSTSDFFTPVNALQPARAGGFDLFIAKLVPSGTTPPVAIAQTDMTVEVCPGAPGVPVTLDGSGSVDCDGTIVAYTWTGPFGTVTGVSPTVTVPPGTSVITLVVTDDDGADSAPASFTVSVVVQGGDFQVDGFGPPLAALVCVLATPPLPEHAFKAGSTLPLSLRLLDASGEVIQPDEDPSAFVMIGSLTRVGDTIDLDVIDLESGHGGDDTLFFHASAGGTWSYNLSTKDLTPGTYEITILVSVAGEEPVEFKTAFVLR